MDTSTTAHGPNPGLATEAGVPNVLGRVRALLGRLAGALRPVHRPAVPLTMALTYFSTLVPSPLSPLDGSQDHHGDGPHERAHP